MTGALWLGTYLLHSTVLCGAVALFRRRLRRVEGVEYLWRFVLCLPLASTTLALLPSLGAGGAAARFQAPDIPADWMGTSVVAGAAIACLALGALLVLRDMVAHHLFVRHVGPRRNADAATVSLVSDVLNDPRLRTAIRLTCASGATSPMVLGRREVCLPDRAVRELGPDALRALVAHEVAHVIRRDRYWFTAIAWLESALFVQPLNRIGRRELRHLAELSCDEWAARRVADPFALARVLVEVASWPQRSYPATTPEAAAGSGLTERVQRLVEGKSPVGRRVPVPCIVALSVLALALPALASNAAEGDWVPGESAAFRQGYELGRAHAARNGVSSLSGRGEPATPATSAWRQAFETRLQERRPPGLRDSSAGVRTPR